MELPSGYICIDTILSLPKMFLEVGLKLYLARAALYF